MSKAARFALLISFVVCAVSVAAVGEVRFTGSERVVQMRMQLLTPGGAVVFDSDWKSGNLLDWIAADSFGHPLAYGIYRLVISSKDLAGQNSERHATLRVEPGAISVDSQPNERPAITLTAHDGQSGQLITTSGDLSFRFGDFLNRKDAEVMRLTAQGDLDVAGLLRTGKGIVFPDGSIQRSAGLPSIMRQGDTLHPSSNISGAGTTNQVTKWLNGPAGTVGDSAIAEVGGKVGIGTTNPGGQLHIFGASNLDVFAGMGPDVISGPGFNYGYAGNSFGVGAGFFNVRPATGATGVNPSLRFMTVDTERMIITNAGNIGAGTSTPTARLHVMTEKPATAASDNGTNATPVLTVMGGAGGDTNYAGATTSGNGADVVIQAGDGGNALANPGFTAGGNGGSIALTPGAGGAGNASFHGSVRLAPGVGAVTVGSPTGWGHIVKMQVNGDVLLGNPTAFAPTNKFRLQIFNEPSITSLKGGIRVDLGSAGNFALSIGPGGAVGVDTNLTSGGRFIIHDDGKIGIGTTSPTETLHVGSGTGGGNIRWGNSLLGVDQNGSIELGGTNAIAGGGSPYIDFHGVSSSAQDFNVRLVNDQDGMLHIVGGLRVDGPLIKPFGSFRIDHPLDPENKYLYHSFVESPDMKNIYDGVVQLDGHGEATMELPEWFEALNGDFRYQLTAVGKPSPSLYVADEIANNRFKIAGGTAGAKVSWQVTGIRHDACANAHRIPVEENKPAIERGISSGANPGK